MRFSVSTARGKNARAPASRDSAHIAGAAKPDVRSDKVGKFVVATIGSGFLAVAGLALWILWIAKTGTFGTRETALSVLTCLPFVVAAYVGKTKDLRRGQTMMTAIMITGLTVVGSLLTEWSSITTALLTLAPLFAVLHLARHSVVAAAGFAMVGIGVVQYCANVTDPLQLTLVVGLHLIASMISLQTKAQLQRLRVQLAEGREGSDQDHASDADLVTQHDPDGLTLFASKASMQLLGVDSKDLLNLGLHDKVHVQDRVAMLKAISDAAATLTTHTSEFRIRSKQKIATGWKWVSMQCVPERDETTGAILVNARIQDVTTAREQAGLLQIARDAESRARNGHRSLLENLRTRVQAPLSELVKKTKGLDNADATQAYVSVSASRLQFSLDELIDAAEIEIGQYPLSISKFQIIDAIGEAVQSVRTDIASTGVALLSDVPAGLPMMNSDKAVLSRIFNVVLKSAADQAQAMTSVSIKARQHGAWIRFAVNCQGDLSSVSGITKESVALRLVAALGGTLEETRRSSNQIVVGISVPLQARSNAADRKQPHPQQQEHTSEGDSRARISA